MTIIEFSIFRKAVPKARPRATKRGDKAIMYTPKNTEKFEEYVALVASEHRPKELLKDALEMELHFFLQRPKSLPKKVSHNIKKPDVDNLAKSVMDGLEGVIYERDAQVVSLWTTKEYGTPRVEVKITDGEDLKSERWEE